VPGGRGVDHDVARRHARGGGRETVQLDEADQLVDAGQRERQQAIDVVLVQVRAARGNRAQRTPARGEPALERPIGVQLDGGERTASSRQARRARGQPTLEGVAERIQQPLLVITGKHDRLVFWEESKKIADEAPNSTWVLFEEGNHVCNNIPYKYRPLAADWLREQLA